jgi:hypothetical protein
VLTFAAITRVPRVPARDLRGGSAHIRIGAECERGRGTGLVPHEAADVSSASYAEIRAAVPFPYSVVIQAFHGATEK